MLLFEKVLIYRCFNVTSWSKKLKLNELAIESVRTDFEKKEN